jgi:hypothetical protein
VDFQVQIHNSTVNPGSTRIVAIHRLKESQMTMGLSDKKGIHTSEDIAKWARTRYFGLKGLWEAVEICQRE